MSDFSATLNALMGDDAQTSLDRAANELRGARPLVVETEGRLTLAAALDGVSPSLFSAFTDMEAAVQMLGVGIKGQAYGPVGVKVQHR